jgi:hypothetical protein
LKVALHLQHCAFKKDGRLEVCCISGGLCLELSDDRVQQPDIRYSESRVALWTMLV